MTQPYASLEEELERYHFSFPILARLSAYFDTTTHLSGEKIGWHCHLTGLTAAAAKVLLKAGVKLYLSETTPATTDWAAVTYMKQLGAVVYQGEDGPRKVLGHEPSVFSDTGFVLNSEYLKDWEAGKKYAFASCEITTSGIHRLRSANNLPIPVININDGELKTLIENYHGVGDGVLDALFRLTWRLWSGRPVAIVGYGRVGAGVASYLKRAGATVFVVETNPIRQLVAHYDGFGLLSMTEALACAELLVTATGSKAVVGVREFEGARDGLILMNVGHWADEIDLVSIKTRFGPPRLVAKNLEEFAIAGEESSKKIYLVAGAEPANVVMLSGSPEPTLIHLTTELLCMNYLIENRGRSGLFLPGENPIPHEVERQSSNIALASLGLNVENFKHA